MKKILIKLSFLSHLKNAEHFDLMEAIITSAESKVTPFQLLVPAWNNFKACFEKEDELFKLSQKSDTTIEIEAADKKRNKLFRLFKQSVNLELNNSSVEKKEAADRLKFLLDVYKDISYVAYTENSALLTNFLQDLEEMRYSIPAGILQLTSLAEELKKANDLFKDLYRYRTSQEYESLEEKLKEARKESDLALFTVSEQIGSLYQIEFLKDPETEETKNLSFLIKEINAHLDKAETIYARRVPSYHKGKDGDGGNEPEPAPEPELITLLIREQSIESVDTMRLRIDESEEFDNALASIVGGFVRMRYVEESPDTVSFRIKAVSRDENKFINSILMSPPSKMKFNQPFEGSPVYQVWAEKDDKKIAWLQNVLLPEMYPST